MCRRLSLLALTKLPDADPSLRSGQALNVGSTELPRWPRNTVSRSILLQRKIAPTRGLGRSLFTAHTSPGARAGDFGFRQMWRTTVTPWVVPQNSLSPDAEIGNEGDPFRCLGLHTHQNAPAEAQARFSEDPAKPLYRIEITAAQPDTTGRLDTTRRTFSIYQPARLASTNCEATASRPAPIGLLCSRADRS